MESGYIIKFLVIIVVVILYLYFKKQSGKEDNRQKAIINKYKVKNKPEVHIEPKDKEEQFRQLRKLITLLTNQEISDEILNVIYNRQKSFDTHPWHISHELFCKEVINYQYKNNIYLYGYFDWKSPSYELDKYITNALKANFNIEANINEKINLTEFKTIPEAFPLYEKELSGLGLKLTNIDNNSDSYIVVIVKNQNFEELENIIQQINLKLYQVRPYGKE